jgi:hypothetical protein
MILNIKRAVAIAVGLFILSIILFMPSTTVTQPVTPPVDDEPALLPAPEPLILATSTSVTEPEPLPPGVKCLADCPLIEALNNIVEDFVRLTYQDKPVLIEIAECESTFRHWDPETGEPLSNPNSSATGAMQLMASYHREPASNLGWDIDTLEGNLAYAEYLYDTEGVTPWDASRKCWESKGSANMALNNTISGDKGVFPTLLAVR